MSVSKPIITNNQYNRRPSLPDFWDNFSECDVKCYICDINLPKIYIRQLALNICTEECFDKYMAIPKPSIILLQCHYDNAKIEKKILDDSYLIADYIDKCHNEQKFPVLYYSAEKLDYVKKFNDKKGIFPEKFNLPSLDGNKYKYAWGYLNSESNDADWFPISLDCDYMLNLIGNTAQLYDIHDEKSDKPLYTFTALIFNKFKV